MSDTDTDRWPTTLQQDTLVGGEPPPPAYPPPPPPDRRIGAGMILGIAALLLAAAGAAIAYALTQRDTSQRATTVVVRTTGPTPVVVPKVAVPNLVGRSFTKAQAVLDRLDLGSTRTGVTSRRPGGSVVSQAPAPGTRLKKGSSVTLVVATGRPTTTASASTTTPPTTTSPATTTASTAPTTTAAAPPAPRNATVPDVTNEKEAAAAQSLNEAGVLASLFFVPGSDPLGTVEQQAKPSGTTVPYHAHVQINVSSGPGDKPTEQVPDVVGRTLQQALAAVNGAHLRLIYVKFAVTSRSQAGKIVQQSPLGGEHAPQNAQVLVFLGAYRA